MRFIPQSNAEVIDFATNYFRVAQGRCTLDGNCRYLMMSDRGYQRCVIGSMLEIQTDQDTHFLRTFTGGISQLASHLQEDFIPESVSRELLAEVQMIHDSTTNWNWTMEEGEHGVTPYVFGTLDQLRLRYVETND